MDNHRWKKILAAVLTGGHSYWVDPDGLIAVADGSMRNTMDPESTDDGLVLVNRPEVRSAGITLGATATRPTASIPCIDYRNSPCSVVAGTREAVALAQYMDVPLRLVADGVAFVPEGPVARKQAVYPEEVDPDAVRCARCGGGGFVGGLHTSGPEMLPCPVCQPDRDFTRCARCGEETGDADRVLCALCRGHKGEPYPEPDDAGGAL